jgi:hypothetical protein
MSDFNDHQREEAIGYAKRLESLREIASANFPESTDIIVKTVGTANSASLTIPSWVLSALLKAARNNLEA